MELEIKPLVDFFKKHTELTIDEIKFLECEIPVIKQEKNNLILKEGQVSREFYFIIEGSIRLFYNTEKEEKTAFFYFKDMFVSSYESFTKQTPSKHNLETLEETKLAVINVELAQKILMLSPKFEFLARVMMEEELRTYQEIIYSFVAQNTEERYIELQKKNSDLLQKIPQYQLATFLGVSAETLSRIRRRIKEKGIS